MFSYQTVKSSKSKSWMLPTTNLLGRVEVLALVQLFLAHQQLPFDVCGHLFQQIDSVQLR